MPVGMKSPGMSALVDTSSRWTPVLTVMVYWFGANPVIDATPPM